MSHGSHKVTCSVMYAFVCAYIYMCVYVYIYTCMYICIYIHINMYVYTSVHMCHPCEHRFRYVIYICRHQLFLFTYIYTCTGLRMYMIETVYGERETVYIHIYMYTHVCVYVHVCDACLSADGFRQCHQPFMSGGKPPIYVIVRRRAPLRISVVRHHYETVRKKTLALIAQTSQEPVLSSSVSKLAQKLTDAYWALSLSISGCAFIQYKHAFALGSSHKETHCFPL